MSVAPNAGVVDLDNFLPPTSGVDGVQGQVPKPLAGQQDYVLTASGWVALSSLGTLIFQGTWNASTNTPTLTSSVGTAGYYYVVSVAGNTDLNGITTWTVGDWALFNGSVWQKIEGGSTVDITGGQINNTVIGNNTPAAGTFTTITGQTATINGTGQNLVANSQTIGGLGWGNNGTTTATINTAVAPDSTTTASTITGASSITYGGNNTVYNVGVTPSTQYTFSCYVKLGTATTVSIGWRDNSTGGQLSTATTTATNWERISITFTSGASTSSVNLVLGSANGTFFAWGAQANGGATATAYVATSGAITLGNPYITIGTALIGVTSTGALYVQPAGSGALQAQATTSTAVGGNARGANAVDWQTGRSIAAQVASGSSSGILGGFSNSATGQNSFVLGGAYNTSSGYSAVVAGGYANQGASNFFTGILSGYGNSAAGYLNIVVGGYSNSGTSASAVTTQSATMNGTTAVTLSGSNANIKVGQLVTGTSISNFPNTYVAAISGTSLTLSQVASGSSTSTLSFFTPHGVVVGGGNNQATGAYSVILGGGDAGTAANRNVASGDWSTVVGGRGNQATGVGSFVGGGGNNAGTSTVGNTASGISSFVGAGVGNSASNLYSAVLAGQYNTALGQFGTILSGKYGTDRAINGYTVFSPCNQPISAASGVSQAALLVLGRQTTDATPTVLTNDASSGNTVNQVILPNNAAYYFKGSVIANVTGAANGAAWDFTGAIMRGANAASTVLIGTPSINRVAATAGATAWTIAITADTTNGGLAVTVTGAASTTIRWVAKMETTEVTY